jgi:hypothetical protein
MALGNGAQTGGIVVGGTAVGGTAVGAGASVATGAAVGGTAVGAGASVATGTAVGGSRVAAGPQAVKIADANNRTETNRYKLRFMFLLLLEKMDLNVVRPTHMMITLINGYDKITWLFAINAM